MATPCLLAFADDSLSAHKSELDRMRGFYAENVEGFKLVEKRETMWKQKLEMEARANDPNHLRNRGGKLLQEQRQEQKLMKEFPKVETDYHTMGRGSSSSIHCS